MKKTAMGGSMLIVVATLIWGIGIIALREGMRYMGPLTLTSVRFLIGGFASLGPAIYISRKNVAQNQKSKKQRNIFKIGFICGTAIMLSVTLRQFALLYSSVGRVSFITSLFVIIVPVTGIIFRRKVPKKVWIGVFVSVCGMYFLGFSGGMMFNLGDVLALICAFLFATHILLIDRFAKNYDAMIMTCIQSLTVGILTFVLALIFESPSISEIFNGLWHILYAGIMSSFVAHILQIKAQKTVDPAIASILFSLEAVFATIVAGLVLSEILSPREALGCILLLTAVIISKLPLSREHK
jgi:drug/metabolite transporter (DMT)-like permease